jgi:hypothetical protein
MNLSNTTYPNMKRKHQYCYTCGTLLPAPGFFCVLCDPPMPPEPDSENSMNAFQTFFRITLLTLIFIIIMVVKLEINLLDMVPQKVITQKPIKLAKDKDFKLFFKVNVPLANLRDKPSRKTSNIIFKLTQGTQVEIVKKEGKWSKIRTNSGAGVKVQVGWIGSRLLDSEIK